MKTGVFRKKYTTMLLGFILALSGLMSANAQGLGFTASNKRMEKNIRVENSSWNDVVKEELQFEGISIDIEEVATVTFINKMGEVVAVLKGDKSVLKDFYEDKLSKAYFLSSYGVHDVYLVR